MKHSLNSISQPTQHARPVDIMDELAVYGIARDTAKEEAAKTDQDGTPVFGFTEGPTEFEITTADPMELAEYNINYAIVAPDREFNLIVRKDNPEALHKLPEKTLRSVLRRILDSV